MGGEAVGLHAALFVVAAVCSMATGSLLLVWCMVAGCLFWIGWQVMLHADAPILVVMMGKHRHDRQQHTQQQQQVADREVAMQAYHSMEGI